MRKVLLTSIRSSAGFSLVENLVAMSLISIAMMAVSSLMINSMHGNSAARTHSALIADVQAKLDAYRQGSFNTLLANIGTPPTSIADGATGTVSSTSTNARASYLETFTAIKNNPDGVPQAVRVRVAVTQRRGVYGHASYSFETIIANVN